MKEQPTKDAGRNTTDHHLSRWSSFVRRLMLPVGGSLFRKYVIILVILVSGALLTSILVQLYFSYQENQMALFRLQREKAVAAASSIAQFVYETERQIRWVIPPPGIVDTVTLEQRNRDYNRLLQQVPAVTEISYLDPSGQECLHISRVTMSSVGCKADFSQDPKFREAQSGKVYFGPVYFRNETEPYMPIAIAESGEQSGVVVVEVNLKFAQDVISQIKVGEAGYAYVVGPAGLLIAHPDISLVLRKTDLSALPQVQAARAGSGAQPGKRPVTAVGGAVGDRLQRDEQVGTIARDAQGRQVLTAYEAIDPLGWYVFVEQPLAEAFAPLYDLLLRTGLLLLVGLVVSVAASLLLARSLVTPIRTLQAGAANIGAGALDQRIEVHTGDELEALADDFNRMTEQVADLIHQREVEARVRERLEQEMSVARDVQQTMLPAGVPELPGWQVATYYKPARSVGGDFYDFRPYPDGRLGVIVGDVTGKGVPAAMVMSGIRSIVRAVSDVETAPARVLKQANDLLCDHIPRGMFVTCLYAVLDPASGQLRYANAGHMPPYRLLPSTGSEQAPSTGSRQAPSTGPGQGNGTIGEMAGGGLPLGLTRGVEYDENEVVLTPEERVLFYSDGLVEAHNPQREMLGFDGLQTTLAAAPQRDGAALIEFLLGRLATFTGVNWEQEDDLVLLVLERGTPSRNL